MKRALSDHLLTLLKHLEIRAYDRTYLIRQVPGDGRRRCAAFYDGNGLVELATKGRPAEELAQHLLHEVCHAAGLTEDEVEGKADAAAWTQMALRLAAALRLVEVFRR